VSPPARRCRGPAAAAPAPVAASYVMGLNYAALPPGSMVINKNA